MIIDFHSHSNPPSGTRTIRSVGIHPQDIPTTDLGKSIDALRTEVLTEAAESIGECGLDNRYTTSYEVQKAWFLAQAELAEELQLPLTVHCVKRFNELTTLRIAGSQATGQAWKSRWVVHGFTGSTQLAQQLRHCGIAVSFGAALLDDRRSKVQQSLIDLGLGNFLLETDVAPVSIRAVYAKATQLLNVREEQLEESIENLLVTLRFPL